MSNFLELVAKERIRKIVDKGYTREHDDEHTKGELADAGACYAANNDNLWAFGEYGQTGLKEVWPWDYEFFKKEEHDRKQQLIIAAAFINAEYDRIIRAEQKDSRCRGCESLKGIKPDTWCSDLGVPMDEHSARCDEYRLPPFEASEDNPLFKSFMKSSTD